MRNQPLMFSLWSIANEEAKAGEPKERWLLEHRAPDGDRWLEIGRFGSKKIAQMSLDAFVAHGHGSVEDYRIGRVVRGD